MSLFKKTIKRIYNRILIIKTRLQLIYMVYKELKYSNNPVVLLEIKCNYDENNFLKEVTRKICIYTKRKKEINNE